MASSHAAAEFNEAEDFDEYNPHPYQGGYDIALAYGSPLPPSSTICYPIKASPPSSPTELERRKIPGTPPKVREPRKEPPDEGRLANGGGPVGEDTHGVDGETEDYLQQVGYWTWDFDERHGWKDSRDCDVVSCAAAYLFEYLHTYGEKRDETYNYGNLNYAYERHSSQEPLSIQFNPHEASWCARPNHRGHNQEELHLHHENVASYGTDIYREAPSGYAYNWDSSKMAHSEYAHFRSWQSFNSYNEEYCLQVYPPSEHSLVYERHHYEEPLSAQHEEFDATWSQKYPLSELYDYKVPAQPLEMHPFGNKFCEQPPLDMFDFIKQSWNHIVNDDDSKEIIYHSQLNAPDDPWNEGDVQPYFPSTGSWSNIF